MQLNQSRTCGEVGGGETLTIVELGQLPEDALAATATTMYKQPPTPLINEIYQQGAAIFQVLQQKKLSGVLKQGSQEWRQVVGQYSKDMQEMLRTSLFDCENTQVNQYMGGDLDEADSRDELSASASQVIFELGIWGVVHICFIDKGRQYGNMTFDLLNLLHSNTKLFGIQKILDVANYLQEQEGCIELHDQYWAIVLQLVTKGYFKQAADLLSLHSEWQRYSEDENLIEEEWKTLLRLMGTVRKLILSFPQFQPQDNFQQFTQLFLAFRECCTGLVDRTDAVFNQQAWSNCMKVDSKTTQELLKILELLRGSEQIILQNAGNWFQLLISILLFQWPEKGAPQQLPELIKYCWQKYKQNEQTGIGVDTELRIDTGIQGMGMGSGVQGGVRVDSGVDDNPSLNVIAQVLIDAVQNDLEELIELLTNNMPAWFQAHIWDVLSLSKEAGQLKLVVSSEADWNSDDWPVFQQIAEYKLLTYAQVLSSFGKLIPLAAQYLCWCPQYGRETMKKLIQQIPILVDEVALDVLRICEQYGIGSDEEAKELCRKRGMAYFQKGDLHLAVDWFAMGKNVLYTHQILNIFIKKIEQYLISNIATCKFCFQTWGLDDQDQQQIKNIVGLLDAENVQDDQKGELDLKICKEQQQVFQRVQQIRFLEFVSKIMREGQTGQQLEILTELLLHEYACPDTVLILVLDQLLFKVQERKNLQEELQMKQIKNISYIPEQNFEYNIFGDFQLKEKQIDQVLSKLYELESDSSFICKMARQKYLKESLERVENGLINMKFNSLF